MFIGQPCFAESRSVVTLWHSYRGEERETLEKVIKLINSKNLKFRISPLALPYDGYSNKLNSAIPRQNGPDIFIFAHERIGGWARSGIIRPIDSLVTNEILSQFIPETIDPLRFDKKLFGLPLDFKSTVLFYNYKLVPNPPQTTDALIAIATKLTNHTQKRYGLVYEAGSFYHHAAWLFGFGGSIFGSDRKVHLDTSANIRSVEFIRKIVLNDKIIPQDVNNVLVSQLFNEGKTPFVINGPWFLGEINKNVPFRITTLPVVSETGLPARPFLTVEAIMLSNYCTNCSDAIEAMKMLTGFDSSLLRAVEGRQAVAFSDVWNQEPIASDDILKVFRQQLNFTVPMSNDPQMNYVWEPCQIALRQVLRGSKSPDEAIKGAQYFYRVISKPAPAPSSPWLYIICSVTFLVILLLIAYRRWVVENITRKVKESFHAYIYLIPAGISLIILVFIPFIVGTGVSLYAHNEGKFTFVGLKNFINIIFSQDFGINDPLSFYFTLGVTVLWTTINVFLHVTIGVILALLLRNLWKPIRGVYRVLFILPWAIPNYITALIWKGMFHRQFGAINALLLWLGFEPVSWFSHFWTALAANITTNTWLGFPFMMVVTLGALQAIPKDLEEAAQVDGASKFTVLKKVVLPLIKPALIPAVILGSVWTFNMFNIIYLVSAGEPDGSTEILISEAYKWAFTRQEQYGYAAAYATLIFIVLVVYSRLTRKIVQTDNVR